MSFYSVQDEYFAIISASALTICELEWIDQRVCFFDDVLFKNPLHIVYHGGGESHRCEVVEIFWGTGMNVEFFNIWGTAQQSKDLWKRVWNPSPSCSATYLKTRLLMLSWPDEQFSLLLLRALTRSSVLKLCKAVAVVQSCCRCIVTPNQVFSVRTAHC